MKLCLLILAALPLWGDLTVRIERAPLPPEERQEVDALFARKDFARIEALLGRAVSAEPLALLGALDFVGGRMNQAIQAFRRSDAIAPLDDQDRFTLAMALVNADDPKDARLELERLSARHPDQALYLYWLARLDYGDRLYSEAVEKLNKVVHMEPASVRGWDNLGLCFDMMGMTDEAQTAFAQAVSLNHKLPAPSPWPPHNFGHLLSRTGKNQEAEQYLRESLQYDPQFALAHYHLARVLENEGKEEAAIGENRIAASLDTEFADPWYALGRLYRRLGRTAEADAALAEYKKRKAP